MSFKPIIEKPYSVNKIVADICGTTNYGLWYESGCSPDDVYILVSDEKAIYNYVSGRIAECEDNINVTFVSEENKCHEEIPCDENEGHSYILIELDGDDELRVFGFSPDSELYKLLTNHKNVKNISQGTGKYHRCREHEYKNETYEASFTPQLGVMYKLSEIAKKLYEQDKSKPIFLCRCESNKNTLLRVVNDIESAINFITYPLSCSAAPDGLVDLTEDYFLSLQTMCEGKDEGCADCILSRNMDYNQACWICVTYTYGINQHIQQVLQIYQGMVMKNKKFYDMNFPLDTVQFFDLLSGYRLSILE